MNLGQIISEFPTQLLYAALIGLIFAGTGRMWNLVTHRKASGVVGMQMGEVMGGLSPSQPIAPPPVARPAARRRVNFGRVLLHIGVFQIVVNVVAFMFGILLATLLIAAGQSTESDSSKLLLVLVVLVVGTLALIIGFLIIGLRVERSIRWLHMTCVALGIVVTTLIINSLAGILHPTNIAELIGALIFALIQTFFGMGVGGGLSFLIGGRQNAALAPVLMSQPYPYGAPPSVPLYPGQPVGPSRPLYPSQPGPQPGPQPYPPQYSPQQPSPYPPQQGAPYYPPNPGAPQYPSQQGAPQPPQQPYPPNAGQPPRYPPQQPQQYPPQYPPQPPPAGGQGGNNQ